MVSWNEQFQIALDLPERTADETVAKYRELSSLSADFISIGANYGRTIISEYRLPDSEKTLRPWSVAPSPSSASTSASTSSTTKSIGLAGGSKFVARGILFKLCEDAKIGNIHLYSGCSTPSYELSQKAANHELRTALQYFGYCKDGLRVPMLAVVEFLGFRLIAMPLLPIGSYHGSTSAHSTLPAANGGADHKKPLVDATSHPTSTLIYGSDNGGRSVVASSQPFNDLMRRAATDLHLASHRVGDRLSSGGSVLYSAGDEEGHYGHDHRYYLIDLARGFPPESPFDTPHLPTYGQSVFCRLLRPELLQRLKKDKVSPPLSSDALSGWGASVTQPQETERHNMNIRRATHWLVTHVIPEFARELIHPITYNADYRAKGLNEFARSLSREAHKRGINLRHLGLLRHYIMRMGETLTVPTAPPLSDAIDRFESAAAATHTAPHTEAANVTSPSAARNTAALSSTIPPAASSTPHIEPAKPVAHTPVTTSNHSSSTATATADAAVAPAPPEAPLPPSELPSFEARPIVVAPTMHKPLVIPRRKAAAAAADPSQAGKLDTSLDGTLKRVYAIAAVILTEIVGRTLKSLLRETLRRAQHFTRSASDQSCKRVVAVFLNRVDGHDTQPSKLFYRECLVPGIIQRFGSCSFSNELERKSLLETLQTSGYIVNAINICLAGCGVKLTRAARESFERTPLGYGFTASDIRLATRIKHMSVIDFAEGMHLAQSGVNALHRGTLSTKFVNAADRLIAQSSAAFERTLRTDPSHAEATRQLIMSRARLEALVEGEMKNKIEETDGILLTVIRSSLLASAINTQRAVAIALLTDVLHFWRLRCGVNDTSIAVDASSASGSARLRLGLANSLGLAGASSERALLEVCSIVLNNVPELKNDLINRLIVSALAPTQSSV